jgi:hypothetical protein
MKIPPRAQVHRENLMKTKHQKDGRRPRNDAKSSGFNKRNLSGMLNQPLVLFHGTTFLAGDKKTIRAFMLK